MVNTKQIKVSDWVYENIQVLKEHPRETINDVLDRLIKKEVQNGRNKTNKKCVRSL